MRKKPVMSKVDGFRALLRGTVLAATVALMVGAWLARGFSIDGGSMAPGLFGPHVCLECPVCGLPFVVGVENPAAIDRPAACPNCGGQVERDRAAVAPGDGVLVDRRAFQFRPPRRYEVASLREPNHASALCVKRVIGLPGERVSIHKGDVFIDGQISRKSLTEQRALAILVHDNAYRPRAELAFPARWQPEGQSGHWRASEGEFTTAAATETDAAATESQRAPAAEDWLSYRHVTRVGDGSEFVESPVLDTQAYNQTRAIADPHPVRDLTLTLHLQAEAPGKIYLRASSGQDTFLCQLDTGSGQCELHSGERLLTSGAGLTVGDGAPHEVLLSLVDRQVLLAIDGQVVFEHEIAEPAADSPTTSRPFAIASDCAALRIAMLRIDRDVYYTPVAGAASVDSAADETQLAADEFYVLSDNSRIGFDSRYAGFGPAAPFNLFVGKPLAAQERKAGTSGWWGGIQVPAPWRIRYIR